VKIARVRQPGRLRGACFVYVPSLLALLRGELDRQTQATPSPEATTKGGANANR
jgi:hypothetical protein